ncbi:MAG: sigma-70 family RNA polymerase sigma factor [Verrucomicrobiales bacterium]|nr:sigma-70 family RNA polymerase sigma factor [Verrucomicrobiales bacterium]MCP5526057.1 sigma-70 family RNA polymerase sigma factor [Verrucomicrobiales bacterium]
MDSETAPDTALMLRVRSGDREAFARLVERYQQPVISFIFRSLGDLAEAEDLSQQVFVQVHKAAARYQPAGKFSTWLFTIARNLCLNELRRRARHPAHSLEAMEEGEAPGAWRQPEDPRPDGPVDNLLRAELEARIEEAIRDLPENQRTALLLCREETFSYEDIGRVLGCSLTATKSLIHRARETLKGRLKPYLRSGEWDRPTD